MSGPMKWDEYGAKCRESGQLALEVFACVTTPVNPGRTRPDAQGRHPHLHASGLAPERRRADSGRSPVAAQFRPLTPACLWRLE